MHVVHVCVREGECVCVCVNGVLARISVLERLVAPQALAYLKRPCVLSNAARPCMRACMCVFGRAPAVVVPTARLWQTRA